MRSRKWLLMVAGTVVLSLAGCQGVRELKKEKSDLEAKLHTCHQEKARLESELQETQQRLMDAEANLETAQQKQ